MYFIVSPIKTQKVKASIPSTVPSVLSLRRPMLHVDLVISHIQNL